MRVKSGWRKGISFALIFGLLFTLLQPLPIPVHANTTTEYFIFDNLSKDYNDPTKFNSNQITVTGTFHPSVSTSSISYRVETLAVKDDSATEFEDRFEIIGSIDGSGTSPILTGNRFTYNNIPLGQGLNRIVISGRTSNGNEVSSFGYAYFTNVPAIYDVQLVDGTPLTTTAPVIVTSELAHIMLKAPNATSVTVNGQAAFSVDGTTYLATNLSLTSGLNNLTIIAYNETMTYSVTRQLVYFNTAGSPIVYGLIVHNQAGDPEETLLDGRPTVGPNEADGLKGELRGYVLYRTIPNGNPNPALTVRISNEHGNDVYDGSGNLLAYDPVTASYQIPAVTVTRVVYTANYTGFYFETNDILIKHNDQYTVSVTSSYNNNADPSAPLVFNYRDANSPYITDVVQAHSVQVDTNNEVTFGSSSGFSSNTMIMELPIWLVARGVNVDANNAKWLMEVYRNGVNLGANGIQAYPVKDDPDAVAFRVNDLPSGDLELRITLTNQAGTVTHDDRSFAVTYVPAPYIQFTNIYNGKIFEGNGTANSDYFSVIRGRIVNFTNANDLDSLRIIINGTSFNLKNHLNLASPNAPWSYDFEFDALGNGIELAPGANTIAVTGTAAGVPVTTTITVYLLTNDVPIILSLRPVPYNPLNLENSDPNGKFKEGNAEYITNEKSADILFTVQNVDNVVVSVDGSQRWKISINGTTITKDPNDPNVMITPETVNNVTRYHVRLRNFELPQSGVTSIVITAAKGSGTAQQVLVIRRELAPYVILSPKLPDERVINQNFVNISIQAEGADRIEIDKQLMTKDQGDIFRYEKKNLRPGVNRIRFTVYRGQEKIDGEFQVNYVEQIVPGAQYKASIGDKSTFKLFGGQLEIKFPRNTVLRTPDREPQPGLFIPVSNFELFDNQEMLFGIANKQDGRTITRYNDDGQIVTVPVTIIGTLRPRAHYRIASELFWTDAGYYDGSSSEYVTVPGMHPYASGNEFFTRYTSTSTRYMEPTNRGTITIKYDDSIVGASAHRLGIWRWVNNGWVPLGGKVDTRNKTVTAPFEGFGYYAVFFLTETYNDVAGHPFARDDVNLMLAQGVMKAKNPVEFGVYDHITRGEFATMLVKILDLPLDYDPNNMNFDDVPNIINDDWLWDYRYIETAANAGIVDGRRPRIFMPNGTLTREEAATMIARALELKLGDPERELARLQRQFTDANNIFTYSITSVSAVVNQKIMQGIPNTQPEGTFRFEPKSNLTRAEAAVMAKRILQQLKKI